MKHEESQCDRYVASRRSFLSSKLSLSLSSTSGIAASVVSRVVDNDREWDRRGQAITRASVINRSKERLNRRQWGARWSGCVRVRGRESATVEKYFNATGRNPRRWQFQNARGTSAACRASPFCGVRFLFQCRPRTPPCPRAKFPYYAHDAISISDSLPSSLLWSPLFLLERDICSVLTFSGNVHMFSGLRLSSSPHIGAPLATFEERGWKILPPIPSFETWDAELILKYASKRRGRDTELISAFLSRGWVVLFFFFFVFFSFLFFPP